MKNFRRLALICFVLVIGLAICLWLTGPRNSGVVVKYKAELRAKGEKISFVELGFPRLPERGDSVTRLTNAVVGIRGRINPTQGSLMGFVGPGRVAVGWQSSVARFASNGSKTNWMDWSEFDAELSRAADALAEIRAAGAEPVRCFMFDPATAVKSYTNWPRYPFVAMRDAAQWLGADTIGALHADDHRRALSDIHTLAQLTEFNREDPMLVAQMIRTAIAGLGLSVTWEALQATNWTEADLAALQRDWERVDLFEGLETAFLGERAIGETLFEDIRNRGARKPLQNVFPQSGSSLGNDFKSWLVGMAWRLNAEQDELFLFRHYQRTLEGIRDLRANKPWPNIQASNNLLLAEMDNLSKQAGGLRKYQFLISLTAIPNHAKASHTVVRHETHRRLTLAAIALKRFQLRHGKFPADLNELVPDFISAVPNDPMSGQPLRYRLNAKGGFVLYSVGEDGKDDNGYPTSTAAVKQFDLWSGRDAVWPTPPKAAESASDSIPASVP